MTFAQVDRVCLRARILSEMGRFFLAGGAVLVVGLIGCQREPPSLAARAAPSPIVPDPRSGSREARDLDGLRVTFLPDGRVVLAGKDQWGNPLDTTYESPGFFKKAVPTLGLSVSKSQQSHLARLASELP